MTTTKHKALRSRLEAAGAKRTEAKRLRDEARRELIETVPAAIDAGISITQIAELADITRPAIYELLRRSSPT